MSSLSPLPQTLRDAYHKEFLIGTALSVAVLRGQDMMSQAEPLAHFNAFTAENSMKPASLQPIPNEFHWDEADSLIELAERYEALVVGHTLVWHAQTPAWFFENADKTPLGSQAALDNMQRHIAAVVGRYKGRVKQWDVVNEAISDTPGEELRDSPWLRAVGEDFIAKAFHMAHKADPDAVLIYNDYNIELRDKRDKTLRLLKSLQQQDVPVHAVGIQGHWHLDYPDLEEIECAIEMFAALGLKVMVTELDIGVLPTKYQGADIQVRQTLTAEMNPYIEALPEAVAQQQAERYEQIFQLFLRYQSEIDRVSFWGVHDGISWLNHFPVHGRTDYPLLFGRDHHPKPAFHALLKTTSRASHSPTRRLALPV